MELVADEKDTNVSSLPEHIHHLILSLGTLRDAVKTAALSTEWRHCYRSLSNLKFTDRDMLALGLLPLEFFHKSLTVQNSIFKEITSKFIGSVNAFLQSTTITRVETFAVSFWFFDENGHHLDEWIRFAIASGAKELDLELKVVVGSFLPNVLKQHKHRPSVHSPPFPTIPTASGVLTAAARPLYPTNPGDECKTPSSTLHGPKAMAAYQNPLANCHPLLHVH